MAAQRKARGKGPPERGISIVNCNIILLQTGQGKRATKRKK